MVNRPASSSMRLEEARLCALDIVGVRSDGTKELVSISDGHRESIESWADVLRDLKRRGMTAPVLAVGDGALGILGSPLRRVSRDHPRPVLGAQVGQRHECASQISPARCPCCAEGGPRRLGP